MSRPGLPCAFAFADVALGLARLRLDPELAAGAWPQRTGIRREQLRPHRARRPPDPLLAPLLLRGLAGPPPQPLPRHRLPGSHRHRWPVSAFRDPAWEPHKHWSTPPVSAWSLSVPSTPSPSQGTSPPPCACSASVLGSLLSQQALSPCHPALGDDELSCFPVVLLCPGSTTTVTRPLSSRELQGPWPSVAPYPFPTLQEQLHVAQFTNNAAPGVWCYMSSLPPGAHTCPLCLGPPGADAGVAWHSPGPSPTRGLEGVSCRLPAKRRSARADVLQGWDRRCLQRLVYTSQHQRLRRGHPQPGWHLPFHRRRSCSGSPEAQRCRMASGVHSGAQEEVVARGRPAALTRPCLPQTQILGPPALVLNVTEAAWGCHLGPGGGDAHSSSPRPAHETLHGQPLSSPTHPLVLDPLPEAPAPSCPGRLSQDEQRTPPHGHGPQSGAYTQGLPQQGWGRQVLPRTPGSRVPTGHGEPSPRHRPEVLAGTRQGQGKGALAGHGLALLSLTAHCSRPRAEGFTQGAPDAGGADLWASANSSLLQGFWCWPASQLPRDRLSALVRRMAALQVLLEAWQEGQVSPPPGGFWGVPAGSVYLPISHSPGLAPPASVGACAPRGPAGLCEGFAGRWRLRQLGLQDLGLADKGVTRRPPAQLSCLANLASRHGLQEDFALHPPDLLLFYNLSQVREADCRAFTRRAAQGRLELLANLPDQRGALRRAALACLGRPHPRLRAPDLLLLGALVCDMDPASIVTADPPVLQNLRRCPRLTPAQGAALNTLLAGGRTQLGPPGSWTLEGLQALGPLATYISPRLWAQVQEATGLDFFRSVVAASRTGRLGRQDARRFVTSFLESQANAVSSRGAAAAGHLVARMPTGRSCVRGNITAAMLRDDLFLVRYDCTQLRLCLGSRVLATSLDPLLQQPLPTECQRVVKAKLAQLYPRGIPEHQLRLITSLVYLYSSAEIGQWNITSRDTLVALLASGVALDNQTEAVLQKFLDHNGTITGTLLVAVGGSRLCWMSPRQIQTIQPVEFRLAGALDVSSCPQSRKDVLYAKAREAFSGTRTVASYYRFMRPYLGGAPVEELRHLAQANVSMDIDTFTNLNPRVLQSLSVGNVTTLLGQNAGDLWKARSHPTVSSWLRGLDSSALGSLGLDADLASPTGPARTTGVSPGTTPPAPHLGHTVGLPGKDPKAPTSGSPRALLGCLPLAMALPSGLLWLLRRGPLGPDRTCSRGPRTPAPSTVPPPGWQGHRRHTQGTRGR
ncbi:mesothelin-like protein [Lemur catta]|uniref:mesothelin-like protein n=1 Tax=Lemur catta TaxID=9447 RepID=UPI001E26B166|nr:mesothelin-like protein [Lemur catta]